MNKLSQSQRDKLKGAVVAFLLAVLGIIGYNVFPEGDSGAPTGTTTVELGGAHGTPEKSVTVPEAAIEQAEDGLDTHEDARSENPDGVTPQELDAADRQQDSFAASDELPAVTPDAAPSQNGCVTQLVQNYSSRHGVSPRLFVLHYTVSGNRPGWSDVNAVASLFDRPSFQASSNYIIDNEGNCKYIVRESDKAWTQAAANPVSISVEQINSGHEGSYAGVAGLRKLALVAHDAMKRWNIPIQLGAVRGCTVVRPGLVDHLSLGACGGGHHDISPYRIAPVLAAIQAVGAPVQRILPLPPKYAANAKCSIPKLRARLGLHPANGYVGKKTRRAIRRLQARYGIKQTGYAGVKVSRILKLKGCHL